MDTQNIDPIVFCIENILVCTVSFSQVEAGRRSLRLPRRLHAYPPLSGKGTGRYIDFVPDLTVCELYLQRNLNKRYGYAAHTFSRLLSDILICERFISISSRFEMTDNNTFLAICPADLITQQQKQLIMFVKFHACQIVSCFLCELPLTLRYH